MAIKNKRILQVLIPIILSATLIGCSKESALPNTTNEKQTSVSSNVINKEQSSAKESVSYSPEFKENFLKVANHYNTSEGYLDKYKPIEWDEENNKPVLDEFLTVTECSDEQISFTFVDYMIDEEVAYYKANKKMMEAYKKIEPLIEQNKNYENTDEYKEYLQFQNEATEAMDKYYEVLNMEEDSKNGLNYTILGKCLMYSLIGGGEQVHNDISENMDMLGLIVGLYTATGYIGEDEKDLKEMEMMLQNLYVYSSDETDTVYGRISYDKDIDLENKKITQTFTFKKYSQELEKEMNEFEEKVKALEEKPYKQDE